MSAESQPITTKREVKCAECSEQMFYEGHAQHEPEVVITLSIEEQYREYEEGSHLYAHKRCVAALKSRTLSYALARKADGDTRND